MSVQSLHELPDRGPGLKAAATDKQWDFLVKNTIATVHCEPDACDECKPYDGETMRLPEAEELIPIHPRCRCSWTYEWDPSLTSLPAEHIVSRAFDRLSMTRTPASETATTLMTETKRFDKRLDPDPSEVKTWTEDRKDGDEGRMIRVPISSTSEDRDGDRFSESGLRDLRSQIKGQNKPMFLDHGVGDGGLFSPRYRTEDIVGSWEDAEIRDETAYGIGRLNDANPESEWLWNYLQADMPVGWSIGFIGEEFDHDQDDNTHEFHKTDLVETSAVGIPSNPDGVAALAAKAASGAGMDIDEGTLASALVSELSDRDAPPQATDTGVPRVRTAGSNCGCTHDRSHDHDHDTEHRDMDDDTEALFERVIALQEDTKDAQADLEQRLAALEDESESGGGDEAENGTKDGETEGLSNDEVSELRSILDESDSEASETTTVKEDDGDDDDDDDDEDNDDDEDSKATDEDVIEVI